MFYRLDSDVIDYLKSAKQRTSTVAVGFCRSHGDFAVDLSVFRAHLPKSP
jgi:hypothetical protein